MRPHFDHILRADQTRRLWSALESSGRAQGIGGAGSSTWLLAGAIAELSSRPVLLVVAHLDEADEAVEELRSCAISAERLPALETLPGESRVSLELLADRLGLVWRLVHGQGAPVLACPIQALMQRVPSRGALSGWMRNLRPGEEHPVSDLVAWCTGHGYRRVESVEEPGDIAVRGGIVDIFPAGGSVRPAGSAESQAGSAPIRLDFFGDEIESMTEIDLETMGSDRRLDEAQIVGQDAEALFAGETSNLIELLDPQTIAIVAETVEVTEQGRGYFERAADGGGIDGPPDVFRLLQERSSAFCEVNQFAATDTGAPRVDLPVAPLPEFARDAGEASAELGALSREHGVLIVGQNDGEKRRIDELLAEFAPDDEVQTGIAYVHRGFIWGDGRDALAVVPMHEMLHRFQTRRRVRRLKAGRASDSFYELEVGDYVVHADHGVSRFVGLKTMKARGVKASATKEAEARLRGAGDAGVTVVEEYLTLEFAGGAKLHVPASQIEKVQKYIGGFRGKPKLSTIGGKRWQNQKDQVRESVRDLAGELLRVQAAREHMPGIRYPADTTWQSEFEDEFPFEETEDQLTALGEIKQDMTREQPMDRLLCGDVGYGKTELAIRAAFKAVEFGRQVAVLVPTTLLAEQHEQTFRQRFAAYPFRVESISRFKTRKEQNDTLAAARKGQVDVLIGTHRLLSKDVRFADLGLVVVDEEQRFGVEHKNALLGLRMTVDVLTLSATPIPRTLHMSMLGLRDISSLSTAPLDRRAVVTEVIPFNRERVKRAIARELNREGQVFVVNNRVHNIKTVADEVQKMAPDARVVIGHGQMPERDLEEVMRTFVRREVDILVSTTIIESGIDIPTANTMIIFDADRFGLAELHQLRGRVGRYKHRAYCYMLLPTTRTVTEVAVKRLRAIEEYSMLGAGFRIAMRDLEIRGAGNILGPEQSGHIAAVGYDMYCRLLEQAARELKNEETREVGETSLEIGVSGALPKAYIPSDARRLEAYRRLAQASTIDELRAVERDLEAAYGEPPAPARLALEVAEVRTRLSELGVRSLAVQDRDVVVLARDPAPIDAALSEARGTVRVLSEKGEGGLAQVYWRPPDGYLEPMTLLTILRSRLREPEAASV